MTDYLKFQCSLLFEGVRKHEKPSITAIATLGSIIFILLVIVIAMMIKWNLNLQSSNSRGFGFTF